MKAIILLILITSGSTLAQNIRNMAPCWSPDGKEIAYYSNRDGNNEIYILNLDNGENIRITNNNRSDVLPKFSPNGLRLVFFSGEKGAHQISVINLQDNSETLRQGRPQQVTSEPLEISAIVGSHGHRIVGRKARVARLPRLQQLDPLVGEQISSTREHFCQSARLFLDIGRCATL